MPHNLQWIMCAMVEIFQLEESPPAGHKAETSGALGSTEYVVDGVSLEFSNT